MTRRRRSSLDVILDMLKLADERPVRKTEFMYKVNMSFSSAEEYLEFLLGIKTVEPVFVGTEKFYRTTQKGKKMKQALEEILDLMKVTTFKRVGEKEEEILTHEDH
jgi:predicted transcriptional regulator